MKARAYSRDNASDDAFEAYYVSPKERLDNTHGWTVGWPSGGEVTVSMSHLPTDAKGQEELRTAVLQRLNEEYLGQVVLAIKDIRIDPEEDKFVLVGDEERAHLMRPLFD